MPHHPAHNQVPGPPSVETPSGLRVAFAPGDQLLFLGDSITAAQPSYVDVVRQALAHTRPDLGLQVINGGVSGNTVRDLEARLGRDVLAQAPAWVAVCIGTNDYFRAATGQPGGVPLPEFEARYRALLDRIATAGCRAILLTIPVLGSPGADRPIPDPRSYNQAIRHLAEATGRPLVDTQRPFHEVYERAARYKQQVSLTTDGIHPNHQGHALIARAFLVQLGLLRKP